MSFLRTKGVPIAVFAFALCIGLHLNTKMAKADAMASQQGVVLKSTTLVTKKTITVPVKVVVRSNSKTSISYSRGFTGGAALGSGSGSSVVRKAFEYLGRPYIFGASGPRAFDCSGFTAYVYRAFGVNLPHYTVWQAQRGIAVSRANLRPGDLIFFNTEGFISHVGMYIGGGQFIHASSGSRKVTISDLGASYYSTRYVGARRILQ